MGGRFLDILAAPMFGRDELRAQAEVLVQRQQGHTLQPAIVVDPEVKKIGSGSYFSRNFGFRIRPNFSVRRKK